MKKQFRKMDWMPDGFYDESVKFLEAQEAMLDPKRPRQSEWLSTIALGMEVGFHLYQEWMTPAQFCWAVIQNEAVTYSKMLRDLRRRNKADKALILVKAQHPLTPEGEPNDEYRLRLDKALEVAEKLRESALKPVFLVVGAAHAGHEKTLASAGEEYLRSRLEASGDGADTKIIQQATIYSGNEEDWFACDTFLDDSLYDRLVIVGTTGQYMRSYMCCLLKSVIPQFELVNKWVVGHQDPILELSGPWSVGGYFTKGPMEAFRQADEIARRHTEEASSK